MTIDFDTVLDRRNTHSSKWDTIEPLYGVSPSDGLAMWTADMDFVAPQAVNDALAARAAHGIQGYFADKRDFHGALTNWMRRHHNFDLDPVWTFETAGTCNGLAKCIQAFSEPGDGIIVFSPVYLAFFRIIEANNRQVVASPLVQRNGQYHMDLDALEQQLTGRERVVLFCSPHNPGGRIWTVAEQRALGAFCEKHDLVLVSDEVHNDLIMPGHSHTIAPVAMPDLLHRLVLLVATTKTFNIAGIEFGSTIIPDAKLRAKFKAVQVASSTGMHLYGYLLAEAAYRHGDEWLRGLLTYLDENRRILDAGMHAIPGLRSMSLQATYLSWVDFTDLGMTPQEIHKRFAKSAKIAASHGTTFGPGGEQFMRINIATQRSRVIQAVERLQAAFGDLQ